MKSKPFTPPTKMALPVIDYVPPPPLSMLHIYLFGEDRDETLLELYDEEGAVHIQRIDVVDAADPNYRPRSLGTYAVALAYVIAEQAERSTITTTAASPYTLRIMRKLMGDNALQCTIVSTDESNPAQPIACQAAEDLLSAAYRGPEELSSIEVGIRATLEDVPPEMQQAIRTLILSGEYQA